MKVQLPLASVRMKARVVERVARVTVTQTFRNPYPDALEAVSIRSGAWPSSPRLETVRASSRM